MLLRGGSGEQDSLSMSNGGPALDVSDDVSVGFSTALTGNRSPRPATVQPVASPAAFPEAVTETVVQAIGSSASQVVPRHRARRLVMLTSDSIALTLSVIIGLVFLRL